MNEWKVQLIPQEQRESYATLISMEWRTFLFEDETELFAVNSDETPCGALLARMMNGRYEVVSLYVEEPYRQQGIGRNLLSAARRSAMEKEYGMLDVCYRVPLDQSEAYMRFFLQQGFTMPREQLCYYYAPIDRLAKTQLATYPPVNEKISAHIFPVSRISDADARVSYSFILSRLPVGMRAENAPGTLLDDYSLCYVENKNVIAFVIFSEWEERVHLHSVYVDSPSAGRALVALMREAYELLCREPDRFSGFSTMVVNMKAYRLAEALLLGAEPEKHCVYQAQKPLTYSVPLLPEWGGVLARSNALYDALAATGGTVSLYARPDMQPYLTWQPQADMELELFYYVKNEDYTAFSLVAQQRLDTPLEQVALHKQEMEEDPGPASLVPDADNQSLALVAVQLEGADFVPQQTIEGFLQPFIRQAKRLRASIERTVNNRKTTNAGD